MHYLAEYFGRSPDQLDIEQIRAFQVYLVNERKISCSNLNVIVCALRFFYGTTLGRKDMITRIVYARRPRKLPCVLSREEVIRLFEAMTNYTHRFILMTMYAGGLRISEVLRLRYENIDADRMLIHIRGGKGGKIGILAVLHTWGQNLHHHPHLHCVVPSGGLSGDESCWITSRCGFFLPVRVLSIVYRAKFLQKLKAARARGDLQFHGSLAALQQDTDFNRLINKAYSIAWVVYSKKPFGGSQQVLKYLARYTHRIAISNRRLVSLEDDRVKFRWKNYAQSQQWQTMSLSAIEFIRRLMLHVLPKRFVRIRHFGLLANCHRRKKIALCRRLLAAAPPALQAVEQNAPPDVQLRRCGNCDEGRMFLVEEISPTSPSYFDTS